MALHQSKVSFNGGELSEYLIYRTDFAKNASGAARMRNLLPLPFGAFTKRPGTRWLVKTLDAGLNSRAFPFTASDGRQYVLHFTPGVLTIYRKAGTVSATLAFLPDLVWGEFSWEDSLRALQIVQLNDVAFLSHPRFHPLRLTSSSDTSWMLEWVPFKRAPMLDENLDATRTFTVASNPVAATWALGAGYAAGSVVFTNCEWQCVTAHTSSALNQPGVGSNWKTFWRRMYYKAGEPITMLSSDRSEVAWRDTTTHFSVGDICIVRDPPTESPDGDLPLLLLCMVDHSAVHTDDSSVSRIDGTYGSSMGRPDPFLDGLFKWAEVYRREVFTDPVVGITQGYFVVVEGVIYRANVDIGPDEPWPILSTGGLNPNWSVVTFAPTVTYPILDYTRYSSSFPKYMIGNRVSVGGSIYVCVGDHYPVSDNRPGSGSSWESCWSFVSTGYESFSMDGNGPGQYYRIAPERDESDFQLSLAAVSGNHWVKTPVIVVEGGWNLFTYGTWYGTFNLLRSYNQGISWEVIMTVQAAGDRNVANSGMEDMPCWLQLQFFAVGTTPSTGEQRAVLIPERPGVTGYALMDHYVSADQMTGHAVSPMMSGNTFHWSEGAFSSRNGYPRAQCLSASRMIYAGTTGRPVSLWFSHINDLMNFDTGTDADVGIYVTLATGSQQAIRWLSATRRLFIGTGLGEWVAGSETQDLPITPGNLQIRQYAQKGSSVHQPIQSADGLFFMGRKGARLFELAGSPDTGNFVVQDLSRLAEHLTAPGVSNMAFQQTREPCLWMVTRAGALLSFHYNAGEQINAWAMHSTAGGIFRDVVIFPCDTGEDEIFFVVDRGTGSHLERFPQDWQAAQEAGTVSARVDGAVTLTASPWTMPAHYAGAAVCGLADGIPFSQVVTGGHLTFASAPASVTVGLPIASELTLLPIDITEASGTSQNSSSQGRVKRAHSLALSLYQSLGGGVVYDGETQWFTYLQTSDLMDAGLSLRSEWMEITLPPGHVTDLQPSIVHADPYPFTVRAAVLTWEVHEP